MLDKFVWYWIVLKLVKGTATNLDQSPRRMWDGMLTLGIMYTYTKKSTYIICTYVCTHRYIQTHMHSWMHACTHACTHTNTHTQTHIILKLLWQALSQECTEAGFHNVGVCVCVWTRKRKLKKYCRTVSVMLHDFQFYCHWLIMIDFAPGI